MDATSWNTTLLGLQPGCPARPLDWRWQLATRLVASRGRMRRKWIDGWVRRTMRFVRACTRRDASGKASRARPDPAIARACELRAGAPRLRFEVEARLLAGENYQVIADRCGLASDTVEGYEQMFYAVVDRLGARDHVVFMALPGLHADGGPDVETVVKALGYNYGPLVLDLCLYVFGYRTAPAGSEPSGDLVRLVQRVVALKQVAVKDSTSRFILKLGALKDRLDRLELDRSASFVTRSIAESSIRGALDVQSDVLLRASGGVETGFCAPMALSGSEMPANVRATCALRDQEWAFERGSVALLPAV